MPEDFQKTNPDKQEESTEKHDVTLGGARTQRNEYISTLNSELESLSKEINEMVSDPALKETIGSHNHKQLNEMAKGLDNIITNPAYSKGMSQEKSLEMKSEVIRLTLNEIQRTMEGFDTQVDASKDKSKFGQIKDAIKSAAEVTVASAAVAVSPENSKGYEDKVRNAESKRVEFSAIKNVIKYNPGVPRLEPIPKEQSEPEKIEEKNTSIANEPSESKPEREQSTKQSKDKEKGTEAVKKDWAQTAPGVRTPKSRESQQNITQQQGNKKSSPEKASQPKISAKLMEQVKKIGQQAKSAAKSTKTTVKNVVKGKDKGAGRG